MNLRRRRVERPRRRQPLPTWGFLRPTLRRDDDELLRQRLRRAPGLRREYRSGLIVQLVVVGVLLVACGILLVQSLTLIDTFQKVERLSPFAWFLPVLVAALGAMALRRFLRVVAELRKFERD